jgi:tetratricopeptide (TPR) repeat protein
MKRVCLLFLVLICAGTVAFGDDQNLLSVSTIPYGSLPLGSSGDLFNVGAGVEASASFMPAWSRFFGAGLGGDVLYLPLSVEDSIYAVSGFGGPVFRLPLGKRFSLFAQGKAGYYHWSSVGWNAEGSNGGALVLGGKAGGLYHIKGGFNLGLGVSYDYYADLYNGISVSLAASYDFRFDAPRRPVKVKSEREVKPEPLELEKEEEVELEEGEGVELRRLSFSRLFPVLYAYYDDNPLGAAIVKNFEKDPAEDVQISFYVERYMDNPMQVGSAFDLEPGEQKKIDFSGLFTEELMEITEGTKVSANVTLSYRMDAEEHSIEYTPVVEFHNRNALSWDDDRKIASFVTAKDPEILSFSKPVVSWMQAVKNPAIDENLQKGIVLFEAVKAYGIRYEIDPTTPFSELSENASAVDFLQFPRQTLQYTSGDCDDLSALYTALLEAVGVETAVITIPSHIYAAFALEASPEEARRMINRSDTLVFEDGKAWVPVEITMFQDTFSKAWQEGAKEWRENNSRDQARLYPTRESWRTYQAVGFREGSGGIRLPDRNAVTSAFTETLKQHIDRQIYPQVAKLQGRIASSSSPHRYENRLAVLYARHGLYDRALEELEQIIARREYPPALINTGNILFLREAYEEALGYYQRVLDRNGRNRTALLGVARCNHELENYGFVSKTYEKLRTVDPDMAARFAYLDLRGDEANRAADAAGVMDTVVWEEEE